MTETTELLHRFFRRMCLQQIRTGFNSSRLKKIGIHEENIFCNLHIFFQYSISWENTE